MPRGNFHTMLPVRVPQANYIVVGDSMAHRFDGVIIEHPRGPIVYKARWQPMACMGDFFHDGKLSEYLTRILMETRWVRRTADTHWPFPAVAERPDGSGPAFNLEPRDADKCVLLFAIGDSELFTLAHEYPAWGPQGSVQAVQSRCEPLFKAIRTLKEIGYRNVFLHDLSPPGRFSQPTWPALEVRLELLTIGRRLFKEFAEQADIGFVSIWDEIFSEEEGRRPEYTRDTVHLNQTSAALSAQKLYAELERRGFYDTTAGVQPA